MCKRGNMFSLTVLIGRGFVLCVHYFGSAYYLFSFLCAFLIFLDLLLANPFFIPFFSLFSLYSLFFSIFLAPYSGAFVIFLYLFLLLNLLSVSKNSSIGIFFLLRVSSQGFSLLGLNLNSFQYPDSTACLAESNEFFIPPFIP